MAYPTKTTTDHTWVSSLGGQNLFAPPLPYEGDPKIQRVWNETQTKSCFSPYRDALSKLESYLVQGHTRSWMHYFQNDKALISWDILLHFFQTLKEVPSINEIFTQCYPQHLDRMVQIAIGTYLAYPFDHRVHILQDTNNPSLIRWIVDREISYMQCLSTEQFVQFITSIAPHQQHLEQSQITPLIEAFIQRSTQMSLNDYCQCLYHLFGDVKVSEKIRPLFVKNILDTMPLEKNVDVGHIVIPLITSSHNPLMCSYLHACHKEIPMWLELDPPKESVFALLLYTATHASSLSKECVEFILQNTCGWLPHFSLSQLSQLCHVLPKIISNVHFRQLLFSSVMRQINLGTFDEMVVVLHMFANMQLRLETKAFLHVSSRLAATKPENLFEGREKLKRLAFCAYNPHGQLLIARNLEEYLYSRYTLPFGATHYLFYRIQS